MGLSRFFSTIIKRPDPAVAARRIVRACIVRMEGDRYGRDEYVLDKFLKFVKHRSVSYSYNVSPPVSSVIFDPSPDRVSPIVLAAALNNVSMGAYMHERKNRILKDLQDRIIDAASQEVRCYKFRELYFDCFHFTEHEMFRLTPESEARIHGEWGRLTKNLTDWQRINACVANWMCQYIYSAKVPECYVDDSSEMYKEAHMYLIGTGNEIDTIMHELYTFDINEPW